MGPKTRIEESSGLPLGFWTIHSMYGGGWYGVHGRLVDRRRRFGVDCALSTIMSPYSCQRSHLDWGLGSDTTTTASLNDYTIVLHANLSVTTLYRHAIDVN